MTTALYSFVEADMGTEFPCTLTLPDGTTPINLTGKTVTLRWKIDGGDVKEEEMIILSAVAGEVTYFWADGDLDNSGLIEIEIMVTGTDFQMKSLELIKKQIREGLV